MKKWRSAFRMDCFRCFHSPFFYVAIILFICIWISEIAQDLILSRGNISVLHAFDWRTTGALLSALPFATTFCEDYRNRYIWYCLQRTSTQAYAWSKIFSTALFSAIANFTASMLFVGLLDLHYPLIGTVDSIAAYVSMVPYGGLLMGSCPFLYFVSVAICESLLIALLAIIALNVSCLIPDFYVTLATPIISYYIIINACPDGWLSPYRIFVTRSINVGGSVFSLLYAAGFTACCILILGFLFNFLLQRRVAHG